MKKSFMKRVVGSAALAVLFVLTSMSVTSIPVREAVAGCCCSPCAPTVRSQHNQTRDAVQGWLDELGDRIEETLKLQTEQLSNYAEKQILAMERIADAQDTKAAMRLRQELRARAEGEGRYDPDPNGCLMVEMAGYPGGTSAPAKPSNSDAATDEMPDTPERYEGSVKFATQLQDAREELEKKGVSTTDFADVLDGDTLGREPERVEGTAMLVQNIIDPMPPPEMTDEQKETPKNLVLDSRLDALRARQSMVRQSFKYALALREGRTIGEAGTGGGHAIRSPVSLQKIVDKARYYGTLPPGPVSELQALDVLTTYHHEPQPQEALEREGLLTEKNLLKRIYETNALNARINFLRLEIDNRMLMLAATELAGATPRMPDLVATP